MALATTISFTGLSGTLLHHSEIVKQLVNRAPWQLPVLNFDNEQSSMSILKNEVSATHGEGGSQATCFNGSFRNRSGYSQSSSCISRSIIAEPPRMGAILAEPLGRLIGGFVLRRWAISYSRHSCRHV